MPTRIVNLGVLHRFSQAHADSRKWIANWIADVRASTWASPHDVRSRYPTVSFLGNGVVIFNVRGNLYRLEALISYEAGVIYVRWIGTHAAYSKRNQE